MESRHQVNGNRSNERKSATTNITSDMIIVHFIPLEAKLWATMHTSWRNHTTNLFFLSEGQSHDCEKWGSTFEAVKKRKLEQFFSKKVGKTGRKRRAFHFPSSWNHWCCSPWRTCQKEWKKRRKSVRHLLVRRPLPLSLTAASLNFLLPRQVWMISRDVVRSGSERHVCCIEREAFSWISSHFTL